MQRRDRDKVLHGSETGIIQRLPHGEYIELHEPLSQGERYTLTAYEQYEPLELPPAVDGAGVERKLTRKERLRARLSQFYFGDGGQIAKPTAEEYREHQESQHH